MKARDPQLEAAFSDLANALQVAAPLSARLRLALGELVPELVTLETSLERAVLAVRWIREKGGA